MTPGSNQNGSRMMFIPSKPFNNLFNHNQQQHTSPLSSSAPPSSGASGVTLSPTSTTSRDYRQQATSRPLSASNKPVGDGTLKSKIVSPYIVSAEGSRQSSDDRFGSHSPRHSPINQSVGGTPKVSRLPPTSRFRSPVPSSTPQAKRPVSTTTTTTRTVPKPQTPTQNGGFKQQVGVTGQLSLIQLLILKFQFSSMANHYLLRVF